MGELLNCPFCGGEARLADPNKTKRQANYVFCGECGASSGVATEAEAIAAWNARAERTCEWMLEHSGTLYDKWRCSECGYLFVEPRCDQGYTDMEPSYCPSCGARVIA